jgi:hypothetical protein
VRQGILIALICAFTTLALWSVWNPDWYYLGRFVLFSVLGALALYALARGHRHAATLPLLYLTAVVIAVLLADLATASPSAAESLSMFMLPVAIMLSLVTVLVAVTVGRTSGSSMPAPDAAVPPTENSAKTDNFLP